MRNSSVTGSSLAISPLVFSVLLAGEAVASDKVVQTRRVILEGDQAAIVIHQCTRESPEVIRDVWIPENTIVKQLDTRLSDIAKLESTLCCAAGERVADISKYYLQYAGLVIEDRKLIYINALPKGSVYTEWRNKAVLACETSKDYWGVLYDPETGRFFSLAFNGEPDDEAH